MKSRLKQALVVLSALVMCLGVSTAGTASAAPNHTVAPASYCC